MHAGAVRGEAFLCIWGEVRLCLYNRDRSVISKHIKNVFLENELDEKSNMHFLHVTNSDKPVQNFSLDVVISVGYRVNKISENWSCKMHGLFLDKLKQNMSRNHLYSYDIIINVKGDYKWSG